MEYSAGVVCQFFAFEEPKKTAELMAQGLTKELLDGDNILILS